MGNGLTDRSPVDAAIDLKLESELVQPISLVMMNTTFYTSSGVSMAFVANSGESQLNLSHCYWTNCEF